MRVPHRTWPILATAATGAVLVATGAGAASSRGDLHSRTLKPSHVRVEGSSSTRTATLRARITVPRTWRLVTSRAALQTYRIGSRSCTYTTRVRTALVVTDAADASALAVQLAPASGPYVLDEGTRGRAAWRVTRLKDAKTTSMFAVGVYPRSLGRDAGAVAGEGQSAFQVIRVTSASHTGDECHSGTYRQVAGPQIGDALAIARTWGYIDIR